MDKQKVRVLREDIERVLEEVGAEHDVTISIEGRITYDSESCRCRITVHDLKEDGSQFDPEREAFTKHAKEYGLKPGDLGRKFEHNGKWFEIVGLKTKRPKYPVCGEEVTTGRKYKFPEALVKRQLEGGN